MPERARRIVAESVVLIVVALLLAVGLRATVAQAFRIPSASMEPQLRNGDRVVVSRLAFRLHDPRRGDVVVFDCPPGLSCPQDDGSRPLLRRALDTTLEALMLRQPAVEEFIKRVIALPGETVGGRDGQVWVDGRRLIEPYLPPTTRTGDFAPVLVPEGYIWVMGDNRDNSTDSRVFGPVHTSTVVGRAVLLVWPPHRVAFL